MVLKPGLLKLSEPWCDTEYYAMELWMRKIEIQSVSMLESKIEIMVEWLWKAMLNNGNGTRLNNWSWLKIRTLFDSYGDATICNGYIPLYDKLWESMVIKSDCIIIFFLMIIYTL